MAARGLEYSNTIHLAQQCLSKGNADDALKYAYAARDYALYSMMEPIGSFYLEKPNTIINSVYLVKRLYGK